ncbi:putative aspartic proteinase GIP2 [Sesamum alatum]|uniref:Aspartic proteinase GIP2 n=1 Tax=Sesamum alatum TaxID=300844 RepID=A0AAE1Y8R4_9LAMI|nr:putative aspartic proteinase GIP2 [Sesamum alatum]
MASSSHYSILFVLAILISASSAQNGLILPLRKDAKTSQFYTTLELGSNRATLTPIIDLGAQFSWFQCDNYVSSTYSPIPCDSRKCEIARGIGCVGCNGPVRPGCTNDTCGASAWNPFQGALVSEGFGEDTLYAKNQRPVSEYTFSCMESRFMEGLASGANGLVGLARTEISLHKQVANKFNLPDRFSLCFPSSGLGKLSIGGPSSSTISTISKSLKATPLIVNPVSTAPAFTVGDPSDEYFIDVKSIRVGGETLSVKNSYFSIDKDGVGGTKISTIQNFTALHNSIYKPLTRAFTKAASDMKIKSVAAVEPFRACFSSDSISRTPAGPSVPTIDLILPGNDIYWRISGANSMVEVDERRMCLAFVDGGSNPRTSVVIGAHQLEENFLEFDLVSSQLKFSSSLLVQNQSCSRL